MLRGALLACYRELSACCRNFEHPAPALSRLTEAIEMIEQNEPAGAPPAADAEAPVFLLANGWRSGSTLLQRILVTDSRLLLWGEPLGRMALIPRMTQMLAVLSTHWPPESYWIAPSTTSQELATTWIANLYPPASQLKRAFRSLIDTWLAGPAHQRGYARWGLKEVRLSGTDAVLLHWLYPNAKFVILTRHPHACYRAPADRSQRFSYYYRWPDIHIDSAAALAQHWNRLAMSWLELPPGFPARRIRYEDLAAGKVDFRELESWLGLELKEQAALSVRPERPARRLRLAWYERFAINRTAREGMAALGYR